MYSIRYLRSLVRISLSRVFLDDFFQRPPSSEWISSPPLVAAVLIAPKVAGSPGSGRMRVIGFIFFHPRPDQLYSP